MTKPLGYFVASNADNCDILASLEANYGSFGQLLKRREKSILIYKIAISLASDFSDEDFREELNSLAYEFQHLDCDSRIGLIKFLMEDL